jgi:surfactin synthase thioesterase subunit
VPVRLLVASHEPPHARQHEQVHGLPDRQFLDRLARFAGAPAELLADPELIELSLPRLRADFALFETYRPTGVRPLPVPITVLGGLADPEVRLTDLVRWGELTAVGFDLMLLPGGHFAVHERLDDVAATILATLDGLAAPAAGPVAAAVAEPVAVAVTR